MTSKNDRKKGVRILILEGAGAKGLSQLTALKEIANRIQGEEGLDDSPDLHEWFEFVIGVDTAALIVALIGRLRMPIDKVIQCFEKLGEEVYSSKKAISRSAGSTEYKTTKLEQTLKDIVRGATGNEDETMVETNPDPECKTMIFAMSKHNMNAGLPTTFRSYLVSADRRPDCAIWEAVGASMAHPAHFKSIEVGEPPMRESFVAGALGCSNPTAHALEEVKRVYPNRHVACIVVIGAGHAKTIHILEPSPLQRMFVPTDSNAVAMSITMDAERVAHEMAVRFRSTTNVYFRLSVEQGMQTIEQDSWDQLERVIANTRTYMRQAAINADIDKIVKAVRERKPATAIAQIDGEIQPAIQHTAGVKQCPDPAAIFTGRAHKLECIEKCILNGDKQRCVFVLHGLGGAGKTQIALRMVQKTRDIWSDIVYVDTTSRDTAITALEGFAKAKAIGEAHTDAIRWLSSHRERWLMVFDNADDPSLDIYGLFPSGDHGSILVTTRLSQLALLAQGSDPECVVLSMDPDEALELLLKTARLQGGQMSETELKAAVRLLQEFGHLALAIVHAGAYIWSSKCTLVKYRGLFLTQRRKTLERYQQLSVKVDNYQRSVYTTWYMSYRLLSNRAQQLLWLMAFMYHDNITEELFRRAALNARTYEFPIPPTDAETGVYAYIKDVLRLYLDSNGSWDSGEFFSVMTELLSYSLISYDKVNGAYTLHVLVHDWASTVVLHSREVAVEHTTFLLAVSINGGDSAAEYAYKRGLEVHVNAVLPRQENPRPNNAVALAKVYDCAGKWARKETMDLAVLDACKRAFGDEGPNTLASMQNLALTYRALGRYKEAEALQIRVLEAHKQLSGDEHPNTLTSMHNLALTYRDLGRYKEAEALQVQELEACKRVSGDNHPSTLTSMQSLALTYCDLGRYKEAKALQIQELKACRRASGDRHPNTLTSMHNLALTYRALGRYKEAEALQVRELEACKRLSGDEHPNTLASMQNLALTYRDLGRYKEAEALQVRVLETRKRVSGNEHPDTLTSMHNLAAIYSTLGRYKEAEALQVQALEACKRVSGDEHPSTLASMHGLALTYCVLGRYKEAEALQVRELKARKQLSGDEHPDTLTSMQNLALTYYALGRYEEAEALQVRELEARKRVSGDEHPDTLTSMHNLALTYRALRRYKEAEALQVQELEACKRVSGDEHPDALASMHSLALTYCDLGRYKEAEALQVRVLEARKRLSGDEHPSTLTSMHNLAITYQFMGRCKEAEAMQVQVVERSRRVLGPKHPHSLAAMRRLVDIYQSLGTQRHDELFALEAEIEDLET